MYQYQDTFTGISNLLKNVLPFKNDQVPMMNEFGVPKNVKSKLSSFNEYINKFDITVSKIANAADSFVYKSTNGKSTNESFLFEDNDSSEYDEAIRKSVNYQMVSDTAIKKDIDTINLKKKDLEKKDVKDKDYFNLKKELYDLELNLINKKINFLEQYKNKNIEFLKNSTLPFISHKNISQKEVEQLRQKELHQLQQKELQQLQQSDFIKIIDAEIDKLKNSSEELKSSYEKSTELLKNKAILATRGNFKVYFISKNQKRTGEIDSGDYIKEFIFHILNKKPEICEKFIKNFYGNQDVKKTWTSDEMAALLKPGVLDLINSIVRHNDNIKDNDIGKSPIYRKIYFI